MIDAHRFQSPLALWPAFAPTMLEQLKHADAVVGTIERDVYRPYSIVEGIAIVAVRGVLVHDAGWWWGETSYDGIAQSLFGAIADPEVRGVAMLINSPGGEVSGCFDLADAIYSVRGVKPVHAIVDESAYSAAYALASSADRIILPRTGGVGSIGIISMHVDITKMLDDAGIKVTTFQYGEYKADSQPTTTLDKGAKARIQADVDTLGEMFVELVARNRGLDAAAIRKMEAGCFLGEAGVEAGLADEVMSPDDAFLALVAEAS